MENCVFCQIVAGELPSEKVHHEDDTTVSFPTVQPLRPGHILVVPVQHYRWFWELPENIANNLFKTAGKLAPELKKKYAADYVQLAMVGKDVPHVHMHLIPRMFTDHEPLL
jgi:histidine triad (HIT) family protein